MPQVEFAYNDSPNRSTGRRLFQIINGMQPRGVFELRDLKQVEIRSIGAKDFSVEIQRLHGRVREQLQSSNQKY
jgi:hypothetical protein